MEGLEGLIGAGERGEVWEHCKLGGLRVRRRIALSGFPLLPRRHVATGMACHDATPGHAPEDLRFRSSPPYRRTPCRKRKSTKENWSRHTNQSTWRALSRRRGGSALLARIVEIPRFLRPEGFDTVRHLPRRVVHRLGQYRAVDALRLRVKSVAQFIDRRLQGHGRDEVKVRLPRLVEFVVVAVDPADDNLASGAGAAQLLPQHVAEALG